MSNSAFTPSVLQEFREASVSQSGIVNTTAQTFGGIKTYDPSVAFTPKSGFSSGYQLWKDTSSRLRLNFSGGLLFADDTDATTYLSCGSSGQWTIGNAADTSFPGNNIVGRKDGSSVAAGYVGEYIESGSSYTEVTSGFTNNQFSNIATITLNKGHYLLRGSALFGGGTSAQVAVALRVVISLFANNTTTDHVQAKNYIEGVSPGTGVVDASLEVSNYRLIIASDSTTVYLKAQASNWSGTPVIRGHISAVRI